MFDLPDLYSAWKIMYASWFMYILVLFVHVLE